MSVIRAGWDHRVGAILGGPVAEGDIRNITVDSLAFEFVESRKFGIQPLSEAIDEVKWSFKAARIIFQMLLVF